MIKLRILKIGIILDDLCEPDVITRLHIKGTQEESELEEKVIMEVEIE